jgi:hypothetical protein
LGTDAATGYFRYHSIVDFFLAPGTYVIGGQFLGDGDPFPALAMDVVTLPGYSWVKDRQLYGAGLNFPTVETGNLYGTNGILAADFSIASTAAVPEPTSAALLGIILAILARVLGRRIRAV